LIVTERAVTLRGDGGYRVDSANCFLPELLDKEKLVLVDDNVSQSGSEEESAFYGPREPSERLAISQNHRRLLSPRRVLAELLELADVETEKRQQISNINSCSLDKIAARGNLFIFQRSIPTATIDGLPFGIRIY
jgi:hypothetical protein